MNELANAARIDGVITHCKSHSEKWEGAWWVTRAWSQHAAMARKAASDATWDAVQDSMWRPRRIWSSSEKVWDALWDATRALIAWDEAGDMLDMSVEEVQALATVGIHAAVLLLPAVIAMKGSNHVNDR